MIKVDQGDAVSKLKSGDLVTIEPWDCEGIEQPWGWAPDEQPPKMNNKLPSKGKRLKKVKLRPSVMGIIISFGFAGPEDYDAHYAVLVEGRELSIPVRFLHGVDK